MLEYALHPAIVQGLKAHLCGELICPNDRRYDTTRKVWNGMIDKWSTTSGWWPSRTGMTRPTCSR